MKISIYEKSVRKKNTSFVHCTLTWKWHFHTFYNCFFSIQLSVYLSALSLCKRTEASETIVGSLSLRCGYYYSVSFASIKLCTEAHVATLRYDRYVKHAHNHITPAVEAMDSCFALIRARQHGIAVGSMSWPYRGPELVRRASVHKLGCFCFITRPQHQESTPILDSFKTVTICMTKPNKDWNWVG